MREIKFRGKRPHSGDWLYGSLYFSPIWTAIHDRNISTCWDGFIEVDPATVGQYTGLKDKNGREIYEGDIIWWGKDDHAPASNVFFDDGAFKATDPESDTWELLIDVLNGAKVIGNIHDSPDFLGVTE
jgi:uncharacterized phage protein (TIGR01671 family)